MRGARLLSTRAGWLRHLAGHGWRPLLSVGTLGLVAQGILGIDPLASAALPIPSVSVPSLTVPSMSAPSVSAPSVSAPSVSTPSVSTPSVSTPSVSTPSVSTPSVPTPSVSTPAVSTPAVSTPSVSIPSVSSSSPRAPSIHANGAGSAPAAPSAQAGNSSPAVASASSPTRPTARAASGANASDKRRRSPTRAAAGARPHPAALSKRRLRQIVMALRGCLKAIAPQQAEVLVLRSGIGLRRSYRRPAIAGILRVTLPREAQIERAGVSALRAAASGGLCGSVRGATAVSSLLVSSTGLSPTSGPLPAAQLGTQSAPRHRPPRAQHAISGASTGPHVEIPPPRGGFDWAFGAFFIGALAFAGWLIVSDLRSRSGRRAGQA